MKIEIQHEVESRRFVAQLGEASAVLEYEPMPERVWDLRRTYVPNEYRRRGVAGLLVRHVLDQARADGRRIIPSCWFVADFISAHPSYRELLVTDAD